MRVWLQSRWLSQVSQRNSRGFTLLEVLLATSLLSVVLTSVFGCLYVGLLARSRTESAVGATAAELDLVDTLSDDLANCLAISAPESTPQGEVLALRADGSQVQLIRWRLANQILERCARVLPLGGAFTTPHSFGSGSQWLFDSSECSGLLLCRGFSVGVPGEDGSRTVVVDWGTNGIRSWTLPTLPEIPR